MENILYLPLKTEWYNLIESGIKKEEYREIKPYWIKRLCTKETLSKLNVDSISNDMNTLMNLYSMNIIQFKNFNKVKFIYGYTKKSMTFEVINITLGKGKIEWGAMDDILFIITLGNRVD